MCKTAFSRGLSQTSYYLNLKTTQGWRALAVLAEKIQHPNGDSQLSISKKPNALFWPSQYQAQAHMCSHIYAGTHAHKIKYILKKKIPLLVKPSFYSNFFKDIFENNI